MSDLVIRGCTPLEFALLCDQIDQHDPALGEMVRRNDTERRRQIEDQHVILTTGAAPRCPKCGAEVWKPFPLHDGDTGVVLDPLLTVHCNGTVCDWQGDLQEALAHGNRVALRAREGGGAA